MMTNKEKMKTLTKEVLAAYWPHDVRCVVDIKAYSKYPKEIVPIDGFSFSKVDGRASYVTDGKVQWIQVKYESWDDIGGIVGISKITDVCEGQVFRNHSGLHSSDEVKLMLRPLSQLTETIEHNGERFVPMIELFRLNTDDEHFNSVKDGLKITRDEWLPKRILCATRGDMIIEFDSLKISFRQYDDGLGWDNPNAGNLALIEKLHSWHFDTFGLIEAGLAIPIPSIEQP